MNATIDPFSEAFARLTEVVRGPVYAERALAAYSRWQIGGPARLLVEAACPADIQSVLHIAARYRLPLCVIGQGSNLLFDSRGLKGIVLVIGGSMSAIRVDGGRLIAEAGASVPDVAWAAAEAGLSGLEHTVGIPGTIGGLAMMNGGSQRKSIGQTVVSVRVIDEFGQEALLSSAECSFAYRSSSMQSKRLVIVEVTVDLAPRGKEEIIDEMRGILDARASKFPVDMPSCGSTFLSDPGMYATVGPPGAAIERAGLKGYRRGDAQISSKHANFFVNLGNATSEDMLWLIAFARNSVHESTGFLMDCEVRYVAPNGQVEPAHTTAEQRWGTELAQIDG